MQSKYINDFSSFTKKDNYIYVYVRVSTNLQSTDTQLLEIYNYCEKERLYPPVENIFSDDGISGYKVSWKDRKIGIIINEKCKKEDIIILPELSRAGRNIHEVNEIIKVYLDKKILLIDVKNNIKFNESLQSSIMGQIYDMVSLIERTQISEE